eukprot:UN05760
MLWAPLQDQILFLRRKNVLGPPPPPMALIVNNPIHIQVLHQHIWLTILTGMSI